MLHVKNQSGEYVVAIGGENSHARNKTVYNITLPKLICLLEKNWNRGGLERHTTAQELFEIMEDDLIPIQARSQLYNTAYFYANLK